MEPGAALASVFCIVLAYFLGGIPFGVVVARVIGGPDPRTVGSGRTGGANTLRALGVRAAVAAGLLDVLKGAVATALPIAFGLGLGVQVACGLVAILGHSRSIYIGFGGGRGVAPAFGSMLIILPWATLLVLPTYIVVLLTTRYSSLGSLTASAVGGLMLAVLTVWMRLDPAYLVYAIGAPGLIWFFHLDNIQRLLAGTERKIEFGRRTA